MRNRQKDNTPDSSCGDVFLKTQSWVEVWIRIRFLKRKNPVDKLIKALSKRIDSNLVIYMKFDKLLLAEISVSSCMPTMHAGYINRFGSIFYQFSALGIGIITISCIFGSLEVSLFLCFSMVTAACYHNSRVF